jgi:UDP-N-acetylmuramoyl-tripeptide--D-alanyl-D-alanine ligase
MSDFWTPRSIAATLQGQWRGSIPDSPLCGVSIDSRAIQPGQVFVAIKGDRFDGHDFVDAALQRGAAFAIVDRDGPGLRVSDTLGALQQLASTYRDELAQHGCKVIAVAGSNGKTTTRHIIHHVLTHAGLKGTQSPKSFNNHIGVPLTLLGARVSGIGFRVSGEGKDTAVSDHTPYPIPDTPPDDFVVVEVGTNHPGEIAALARIVRPDIAVITSIGEEHLAFFGDLAGVAREEASLLGFVRAGGAALIPQSGYWPEDFEFPVPVGVELAEFDWRDPLGEAVALPGQHNRSNAAAAVAVARCFELGDDSIRAGLATVTSVEGRTEVIRLGANVTLINDSYNANPSSMYAGLGVLGDLVGDGRTVAILGDMLELGDESDRAHAEVVHEALTDGIELIVLIGERFTAWSDHHQRNTLDDTMPPCIRLVRELNETTIVQIAAMIEPDDTILLKASRGMRLERLIPAIAARFPI